MVSCGRLDADYQYNAQKSRKFFAMHPPRYLARHRSGRLRATASEARDRLRACTLCPVRCGTDRLGGEIGPCGAGPLASVASALPHFGEEPPLVIGGGSGAVFFTGCSLRCLFCQNHQISRAGPTHPLGPDLFARTLIGLQDAGCVNINLVSPTPYVPQILEAVHMAVPLGLRIPLVYNSHGYESLETLALLDGVVDLYLPDAKYGSDHAARALSRAPDYRYHNIRALAEMHRQVGDLAVTRRGTAVRGLIVRHLVLPGDRAHTEACLTNIVETLGTDVTLSLMAQYRPTRTAASLPPLDRPLTFEAYGDAVACAGRLGFTDLWVQDPGSRDLWVPDFDRSDPFEGAPRSVET